MAIEKYYGSQKEALHNTLKDLKWIKKIQNEIPGEARTYKSIDTVINQDESINYQTYFLNFVDLPSMPPHDLTLKIGVPIIVLQNINLPRLYNGINRLSVKKMMNNIIEATIWKI